MYKKSFNYMQEQVIADFLYIPTYVYTFISTYKHYRYALCHQKIKSHCSRSHTFLLRPTLCQRCGKARYKRICGTFSTSEPFWVTSGRAKVRGAARRKSQSTKSASASTFEWSAEKRVYLKCICMCVHINVYASFTTNLFSFQMHKTNCNRGNAEWPP